LPPCIAPITQPSGLVFVTTATNTIQGAFTATTADEYLVVRSTSSTLTTNPVNGQPYTTGDVLGNGVVVQKSSTTSFTANSLLPNTQYYFFIFSLNNQACVNGPTYNGTTPLTGTQTTQPLPPCIAPSAQANTLALTASNTSIAGTFSGVASADDYLIVRSLLPTLAASPLDNTDYNVGDNFGGGIVVANSSSTSFVISGLTLLFLHICCKQKLFGGYKVCTNSSFNRQYCNYKLNNQ
jgi:trimeric autotransporter adhesin